MNRMILLLWCLLPGLQVIADENPNVPENREAHEIQLLIVAVETSGCTFIRNGKRHTAEEAADHLRLKLRRGRRHAKTADEFIENLASGSSRTRKPYFLDCPDSETQTVRQWLQARLETIRAPSNAP